MQKNDFQRGLFQDVAVILFSVLVALLIVRTDILSTILLSTKEFEFIGSFIAGIFFTSVFTTAPAIVVLGEIAHANTIIFTALFGAMGAVIGDFVIFLFIRDRFAEHLKELLKHRGVGKKIGALIKLKSFRWLSLFLGGLVIASPLPDELGITLWGGSKVKTSWFIPLSFAFNFIGILIIGLIAKVF